MPVTMKQLAADVGVSIVTVSKVLHNNPDISKKTRELVLQRARELGYRPNLTARSLVTGRSSLVGLLVPDLVHSFFSEVARSLSAALREQGLYLLICSSESDTRLEQEQLEHLLSRGLDAIVVAPVGEDDLALKMVSESGTPLILLDRQAAAVKTHFVGVNDLLVGTLATEHLIEMGCKNIAHIRGPENSVGKKRLEGYRRALRKAGLPFRPELVSEISRGDVVSKTQGTDAMKQFLTLRKRPDGLFCFSDSMAIGAMDAALALGVSIPQELAVVGCGNLHYDSSLRVPLSSIDQKSERIGQRAAGVVLENTMRNKYDELPKKSDPLAHIILKPELVIRQSSMRRRLATQ